jgi:hypothetical protein
VKLGARKVSLLASSFKDTSPFSTSLKDLSSSSRKRDELHERIGVPENSHGSPPRGRANRTSKRAKWELTNKGGRKSRMSGTMRFTSTMLIRKGRSAEMQARAWPVARFPDGGWQLRVAVARSDSRTQNLTRALR